MFNYGGPPEELRIEILKFFFDSNSDDKTQRTDNHACRTVQRVYSIFIPLRALDTSTTLSASLNQRCSSIRVRFSLPVTYQALFTSKCFLATALPLFIKATSPELLTLTFQPFTSPGTEPNPSIHTNPSTLPTRTLHTILSQTRQVKLSTEQLLPITYHIPFREFLPSLRTVTLHDPAILRWSRFTDSTTAHQPSSSTLEHATCRDRDVFQPPYIADICGPKTRRVLTKQEIQDLKSEMVFPGDLSVLCRYINVLSGSGPLPPIEVRRIVTVACFEEVRGERDQEARKREVLLDLTINVGKVKLLEVRVR